MNPLLNEAPQEYGLLVTLDEEGVRMEFVPDQSRPTIHPHGHRPTSLQDLKLLPRAEAAVSVCLAVVILNWEVSS